MPDTMWHEARKQERKIRGMLVDYKRRAERRREYYEKIKQDPTQFIQLHGRPVKIHLDPAVAYAAEAPGSMMPWRGDADSMIDRFDVRAHLDDLPPTSVTSPKPTPEEDWEERQANYERYRILIQNDFLGIKEEKFLHQIRLEEQFGPIVNKAIEEEKKALAPKKAAIAFTYTEETEEDNEERPGSANADSLPDGVEDPVAEGSDDDSDSDIDLDLTVDVMSLSNTQQQEMNLSGVEYGLNQEDFMSLISRDLQEAEELRVAKEHEDEKAMYSGRKSRKERRALKKKHMDRKFSPPSYAARASPTYAPYRRSSSRSKSRSPTPPAAGTIKFITSFGGESDGAGTDDEGVTGVIILPKEQRSARDRRKNRWDQKSREGGSSNQRSGSSGPGGGHGTSSGRSSSSKKRRHTSRSRSRSRSSSSTLSRRRHRSRYSRSRSRHSRSRSRTRRSRRTRSCSRSRSRSRSRERHSSSWKRHRGGSKRRSYSRSRSKSRSKSVAKKSPSPKSNATSAPAPAPPVPRVSVGASPDPPAKLPSPPCRRYYGRRGQDSHSETASESETEEAKGQSASAMQQQNSANVKSSNMVASTSVGNGSTAAKVSIKMTPQERLKKKMQALLRKQFKADKRIERERAEKAEQERQDREEELREMAIRLRRREREKRHRLQGEDSSSGGSLSRSSSRSRSNSRSRSRSVSRQRSRSRQKSRSRQASRSRSKSPYVQKQVGSGRWSDSGRNRERGMADYSREHSGRSWESSSHKEPPTPQRYRDSGKRRSRSHSPASRWDRDRDRDHYNSRRSRSRSRGRDYPSGSRISNNGSSSVRRKSSRDFERPREGDRSERDRSERDRSERDRSDGYREPQSTSQREYQHRSYHHRDSQQRDNPRDGHRDYHRDYPQQSKRQSSSQSTKEEDRDPSGRIGRIRLVDY